MKKCVTLILILSFVICLLTSCANEVGTVSTSKQKIDNTPKASIDNSIPSPLLAPLEYKSPEEYIEYEKGLGEKSVGCYYTPSKLPNNFEFDKILKRADVYVAVYYTLADAKFDSYSSERLQTLICERSLYEDGSISLNQYISNGYSPIEYNEKTLYMMPEYSDKDGKGELLGYGIVFLEGNDFIYMHIPAIDSLENLLKYTDIVKVEIK